MSLLLPVLERVAPIIGFLLAVTLLAELADRVGVFEAAAHWIARRGRGRLWLLWSLFAAFAVSCTVFLSLDTTAVLLTPVGLAVARQIGAAPRPFALTTLWIANTGSLLLPVSNLTNLLALPRLAELGIGHTGYVRLALAPGLACIAVTLAIIIALHPRLLTARYSPAAPKRRQDALLLGLGMLVCLAVGPAFAIGLPPWAVALAGSLLLGGAVAGRAPRLLRGLQLPWAMAAGFAALTVLVTWAHGRGALDWLASLLGAGTGPVELLRVAGVSAFTANAVNNLPAYLALEPSVAEDPGRLMATLIGVNAGPLITPWASLATLLWLQRCQAAGVRWRLPRLAAAGAVCAAATVGVATLTLALTAA